MGKNIFDSNQFCEAFNMCLIREICLLIFTLSLVNSNKLSDEETLKFQVSKEVKEKIPYYLSGYDEDGTPIWIFETGKYDMRYFVEKGGKTLEEFDIYLDQAILKMVNSAKNSTQHDFIFLGDLEGFDIRQATHFPTIQFIISKFARFEQLVSLGGLKKGWIVNANYLWERIWELASPLLGNLVSNIEIYGTNKQKWLHKLLKELPRDQIPEWYGGIKGHKPVEIMG